MVFWLPAFAFEGFAFAMVIYKKRKVRACEGWKAVIKLEREPSQSHHTLTVNVTTWGRPGPNGWPAAPIAFPLASRQRPPN